jgi:hydrogenase-4 component E
VYPVKTIETLSLLMVITSVSAVEARNLRYATWAYMTQALLICGLLTVFARENPALYAWAATALVTKAIVTPWLLTAYIRRTGEQEVPAVVGFGPSVLVTAVILILFYRLVHTHADFLAPTPEAARGVFRTNLAVALTVFVLGIYAMLTRRDAIKTVIGLCLLENAVHLSLVSLAPALKETPLIGIATEVVVTVYLLLHIIAQIRVQFGSTDTRLLSELHW